MMRDAEGEEDGDGSCSPCCYEREKQGWMDEGVGFRIRYSSSHGSLRKRCDDLLLRYSSSSTLLICSVSMDLLDSDFINRFVDVWRN